MQDHSASDKSVWYALLMLGRLPSYFPKTPFRTVSRRSSFVKKGQEKGPGLFDPDPFRLDPLLECLATGCYQGGLPGQENCGC
jgi:hypothetical protein